MKCYIVVGVTGSGKSNIIKMIKNENKETEFTSLIVDDMLTSNSAYKQDVNNILQKRGITTNNSKNTMRNKINKDYYNNFEKAYWKARKSKGCEVNINPINNDNGINSECTKDDKTGYYYKKTDIKSQLGCDKKFDNMLFNSICRNRGIIYENTGRNYNSFEWIFKYLTNYTINIYFTFLNDIDKLYDRNVERGIENTIEYLKNKNKFAPRFPKVNKILIAETYLGYLNTVKDTIEKIKELNNEKIKLRFYNTDVKKGNDAILITEKELQIGNLIDTYTKELNKLKLIDIIAKRKINRNIQPNGLTLRKRKNMNKTKVLKRKSTKSKFKRRGNYLKNMFKYF